MTTNNQSLELTSRHQLIDLNKEKVNFRCRFQAESTPNGQDFLAVVMNQNDLNNYNKLDDIQMKVAPGKIGGTIVADNNKYVNYFLLLKSKESAPVKVNVTTTIEDIEPNIETQTAQNDNEYAQENIPEQDIIEKPATNITFEKPIYKKLWFWVIMVLAIGTLIYLSYDYIKTRKNNYNNKISTQKKIENVVDVPVENSATMSKNELYDRIGHQIGNVE